MPRRSQDATQIYRLLQTAREASSLRYATYDNSRGAFSLNPRVFECTAALDPAESPVSSGVARGTSECLRR